MLLFFVAASEPETHGKTPGFPQRPCERPNKNGTNSLNAAYALCEKSPCENFQGPYPKDLEIVTYRCSSGSTGERGIWKVVNSIDSYAFWGRKFHHHFRFTFIIYWIRLVKIGWKVGPWGNLSRFKREVCLVTSWKCQLYEHGMLSNTRSGTSKYWLQYHTKIRWMNGWCVFFFWMQDLQGNSCFILAKKLLKRELLQGSSTEMNWSFSKSS